MKMTAKQSRQIRGILIFILLFTIFLISSCSAPAKEDNSNAAAEITPPSIVEIQPSPTYTVEPPTPTITATATIQPSVTPEGLYYFNDFSGNKTGLEDWMLYEIPFKRHDHVQSVNFPSVIKKGEEKQVIDALTSAPVYVLYDQQLFDSNTTISEQFELIGNGSATQGLICRYSTAGWYEMNVRNDGHWTISLAQNSFEEVSRKILMEGNSTPINSDLNTISVSCIDSTISISLNDELLGSVEDSSLPVGDIFGLVYREEAPFEMHAEISKILITNNNDSKLLNIDFKSWGFYFSGPWWAVSTETPKEVRSIMKSYSSSAVEDGQVKLTTSIPSWVIMINPQEMPRDVEINMDVTIPPGVNNLGVGVICDWSNDNGGYILWYRSPFTIISSYDIDEYGIPIYMGGNFEFVQSNKENLLAGETHHITAFCGVGLVKLFIDGNLVESHPVSEFKSPDANKKGHYVGLAYNAEQWDVTSFFIDNYSVTWGLSNLTPTP